MDKHLTHVAIIGGGSAGWLTAAILAAEHASAESRGLKITLLESPDVPIIGVGEGTWPTMRDTLAKIGLSETDFIRECDASFKQGSRFIGWRDGGEGDAYDHPFVVPQGYGSANLVPYWQTYANAPSFADLYCFQSHLCAAGCAPKQRTTPEYAAVANYAYHLDAGKFVPMLMRHATEKLGVRHILDHVTGVVPAENGDIAAVQTSGSGLLEADLFIDCTGMAARLIGAHYGVPFNDRVDILFNDTALAVQVPYAGPEAEIPCQTLTTAQEAGWIWDIGLQSRRGIGHVYSSAHTTDAAAEGALRRYVAESTGRQMADAMMPRKLSFRPGYRDHFWHQNCVAVGMAAGFIEPLEASALVMIELAASMISKDLPTTRQAMDIIAKRYNDRFRYRWERIIDFLKLHYVLSGRPEPYWVDNRAPESVPQRLQELMDLWAVQPPSASDFPQAEEVFPSASYQYVLYGMGFRTAPRPTLALADKPETAARFAAEAATLAQKFTGGLPSNRSLINHIKAHGMPRR